MVTTSGSQPEPVAGRAPAAVAARPAAASAPDWVPWLIALAVFAGYTIISVSRYLRLDPGSWDLGIFTEYVKQLAHLHAPVVNIHGAGFNLFGDHFQPIVGLIAPLFLIFPSAVTLLVVQAFLTAVSVIPVSRAAEARLGTAAGRMIGAAYGLSWGLAQMIDFDFHEIAFAVPLLAFSLSALLRGRTRAAVLWALPLVFVKEDQGFTVVALGLVLMLSSTSRRAGPGRDRGEAFWGGLLLACWGIFWSALAIIVIIPHFNAAHAYPYWTDGGAVSPGGHPDPGTVLSQFGASWVAKLRTTLLILLPVGFLALGSPLGLIAVPSLALRFVSTNNMYWGDGFHYNATVMPIVFLAAVDALSRVNPGGRPPGTPRSPLRAERRQAAASGLGSGERARRDRWLSSGTRWVAPAVMLAVALAILPKFPLSGVWQPATYQINLHVQAEDAALARVPAGTTVEATLTMVAPLAAQDDTYWIGTSGNPAPRYIVFDSTNSGWSPEPANPLAFVEQRHPGTKYQQIFLDNGVYVFRQISQRGTGQ
jgi:uncharacterized membrane protein